MSQTKIHYDTKPWILTNSICFGKLAPQTLAELPKCQGTDVGMKPCLTSPSSSGKFVAEATMANPDGLATDVQICTFCAKRRHADLNGVYCRFCYKFTRAKIPWSAVPFVYVCFDCTHSHKLKPEEVDEHMAQDNFVTFRGATPHSTK